MAILVKTNTPLGLINSIDEGIEQGRIEAWIKDREGNYTYSHPQWAYHAWLHPYVENNQIFFGIIGRNDSRMTTVDYAVYHGRFVEMLLAHFDKEIELISVSSGITQYDKI